MEQIEVTAKFEIDGQIKPETFTWLDNTYPVVSIGRRWMDEAGHHVLVMVPDNRILELLLSSADLRWYLIRPSDIQKTA